MEAPQANVLVTTERRWRWPLRRLVLALGLSVLLTGMTASLALALPVFTELTARTLAPDQVDEREADDELALGAPVAGEEQDQPAPEGLQPVTARFVALPGPVELVNTTTDPATGNAAGFAVDGLVDDREHVVSIVVDVAISGPGPGAVVFHPGSRPTEALRLQLSDSGQLRAAHLLLQPDAQGRVVIAADPKAGSEVSAGLTAGLDVAVTARGVYVASGESAAGRYHHVGLGEVASLVTATDGPYVTVDLSTVPSLAPDTVGHALLRFNANVGVDGGSVSLLGSGADSRDGEGSAEVGLVTWAAPAAPHPGLGGTGIAVVPVGPQGRIDLRYQGGSVLTVDLVGYFTNDRAEPSAEGLLLASIPERLDESYRGGGTDGVDLVIGEIAAGPDGGAVMVRRDVDLGPDRLAFNLQAGQRRVGPLWVDPTSMLDLGVPAESRLWRLGRYLR